LNKNQITNNDNYINIDNTRYQSRHSVMSNVNNPQLLQLSESKNLLKSIKPFSKRVTQNKKIEEVKEVN